MQSVSSITTHRNELVIKTMAGHIFSWLPMTMGVSMLLGGLYLVVGLYAVRETILAITLLIFICTVTYVFLSKRTYALRYLVPGLSTIFLFILLPLFYTVVMGLTNTSGTNLLSKEQVEEYLLARTYSTGGEPWNFSLHEVADGYILSLKNNDQVLVSTPLNLTVENPEAVKLATQVAPSLPASKAPFREIIKLRTQLKKLRLQTPDNTTLIMSGLREFAPHKLSYSKISSGTLRDNRTLTTYTADDKTGFFTAESGEKIAPGFRTFVGLNNFSKILTHSGIWGPFLQIFVWTIIFASCTVFFTFILGVVLASILQWEKIHFRSGYRLLLMLPYAIPAFVSIQVFRGLFNQEFGEINLILGTLFGIKPEWFTDPLNAKIMLLTVNTWLGFPYMMLLGMGLLQSISTDLYKAAAVEGAKPIDNFFRITLPMILPPFAPLLIASFAFNFNNFVLITLLTGGRPDILGATTPAGTTDILVSYTYRIAFENSAQDFGLASAISTIIFLLVGAIAIANIWMLQRKERSIVREGGF